MQKSPRHRPDQLAGKITKDNLIQNRIMVVLGSNIFSLIKLF